MLLLKNRILGVVYNTIVHEIGHSLGLGHYVSDDNQLNNKWASGSEPSPSVMIPTSKIDPKSKLITGIDVLKVFEIYGSKGFYAFSPDDYSITAQTQNPNIPVNPIIPFNRIENIQISDTEVIVTRDLTEVVTISGQIKRGYVSSLQEVLITVKEPGYGFTTHRALNTDKGYFELPMTFDYNSKRGWYSVEVSYFEQSDYTLNFQFYVGDEPWNQDALPETYSIPEPETNIVSGKYLENIQIQSENNEYKVKAYLKKTLETESHVRITAENACPFKKQIFQKDFRYSTGNEISFSFYQVAQGKPDECSIHFTISDFDEKVLNIFVANYVVGESSRIIVPTKSSTIQSETKTVDNDSDNDGVLNEFDLCDTRETWNGYQDDDGCPDTKPVFETKKQEMWDEIEKEHKILSEIKVNSPEANKKISLAKITLDNNQKVVKMVTSQSNLERYESVINERFKTFNGYIYAAEVIEENYNIYELKNNSYDKLNELKNELKAVENSLKEFIPNNDESREKIESAWQFVDINKQQLDSLKSRLDKADRYLLDGNPENAKTVYTFEPRFTEIYENNLKTISELTQEGKNLQKSFCFLFWCW